MLLDKPGAERDPGHPVHRVFGPAANPSSDIVKCHPVDALIRELLVGPKERLEAQQRHDDVVVLPRGNEIRNIHSEMIEHSSPNSAFTSPNLPESRIE